MTIAVDLGRKATKQNKQKREKAIICDGVLSTAFYFNGAYKLLNGALLL